MEKMKNLMRLEIIELNGRKNGFTKMLVTVCILMVAFSLFGGWYPAAFMIFVPVFLVSMMMNAERQTAKRTLHSVLPVTRRDVVRARFLLLTLFSSAMLLLNLVLSIISEGLHIRERIMSSDVSEQQIMSELTGIKISKMGGSILTVGILFMVGMLIASSMLSSQICTDHSTTAKKSLKDFWKQPSAPRAILIGIGVYLVFGFVLAIFWGMQSSFSLVGNFGKMLTSLVTTVCSINDGLLAAFGMIVMGICVTFYRCICTEIKFDKKEL